MQRVQFTSSSQAHNQFHWFHPLLMVSYEFGLGRDRCVLAAARLSNSVFLILVCEPQMPKCKCKFPDEFFQHWTFPKQKKSSLEALGSGHKSDINQQRYTVSSKSTKECNITFFFFLLNRNSYEAAPVMAAEAVMTPTLLTAISPSA